MKKLLLATVATIALSASGVMAAEPSAHGGGMKAGAEMKDHGAARSETTGAGAASQSEMKAGADVKAGEKASPKAEIKGKADSKNSASTKSRSETTGAGANTEMKSGSDISKGDPGKSQAGSTSPGGSVSLSADQKTKIRTTVIQASSAPKVERSQINFTLNVGTVVPRSVHVVTVPTTLVEIHPAWRGLMYFVVGDEIVIVEPGSLKIVAVVAV